MDQMNEIVLGNARHRQNHRWARTIHYKYSPSAPADAAPGFTLLSLLRMVEKVCLRSHRYFNLVINLNGCAFLFKGPSLSLTKSARLWNRCGFFCIALSPFGCPSRYCQFAFGFYCLLPIAYCLLSLRCPSRYCQFAFG